MVQMLGLFCIIKTDENIFLERKWTEGGFEKRRLAGDVIKRTAGYFMSSGN